MTTTIAALLPLNTQSDSAWLWHDKMRLCLKIRLSAYFQCIPRLCLQMASVDIDSHMVSLGDYDCDYLSLSMTSQRANTILPRIRITQAVTMAGTRLSMRMAWHYTTLAHPVTPPRHGAASYCSGEGSQLAAVSKRKPANAASPSKRLRTDWL